MKLSVKQAAEILDKPEQFVRCQLQHRLLPIGCAVKTKENKFSYDIRSHLLNQYMRTKEKTKINNIRVSVSQAAKILEHTDHFVMEGLKQGVLPIGRVEETEESFSYDIHLNLLAIYTDKPEEEIIAMISNEQY